MFSGFDLSTLPSLPLSQRNSLPACPAIYFAVDSKNRVLYVELNQPREKAQPQGQGNIIRVCLESA